MVAIKDINALTVRKVGKSTFEVSSLYGGFFRHRLYVGYTQKEAEEKFKQALAKGEL